ncbi:MAG: choline-sulfatase [Verrucomicrobia bacterium]|nr:choline-sulfatase [Verrucomicrobiota bacterium]
MMPGRRAQLLAALLAAAPVAPAAPNVLLILADDLRPDAPGFAGGRDARTPHLDALARGGAVFPRAACSYPICHVSRSELLCGQLALGRPGQGAPGGPVAFDPSSPLLPSRLAAAGWHTVHAGKWHVSGTPAQRGFRETAGMFSGGGAAGKPAAVERTPTGREVTGYRGWTFKDAAGRPQPELGVGLTPETDRIITARAAEAIGRLRDRPFFLHVNFTAPHDPLLAPPGSRRRPEPGLPANFRAAPDFETGNARGRDERIVPAPRTPEAVRAERELYFRLVEEVDRNVGELLQALAAAGARERTLVLFSSDNGLALGSHGLMGKQNQYEHSFNVPLVLAGPGVPAGRRFAAQCYLRDLYPTLCDLLGLATPAGLDGRSLLPVLRGERTEIHEAVFGYFTDTQRMIRTADGWKLTWYPAIQRTELFHLNGDPDELHDLAGEPAHAARLADLRTRLGAWQLQHRDPAPPALRRP